MLLAIVVFSTVAGAKTQRIDIIENDTIEYNLDEENDKLCADLAISENGLYSLRIVDLYTSSSFTPKISITISSGKKTLCTLSTDKPFTDEDKIFDSEKFRIIQGLAEGEYTVTIENLTKFSDVSFKIETSFTSEEYIETEGNSTFEGATQAIVGKTYYGGVTNEDDKDFFYFDMPYDGLCYIQMYSPSVKYFTVYDSSYNEIGNIPVYVDEEDKVYEQRLGLARGKYYIAISPKNDFTLPIYSVRVITKQYDFCEKEFNNTYESANTIEFSKQYQGNLFGIEDEDFFVFTLDEKSKIYVSFTDTVVSKTEHYSVWITDGKNVIFSNDECKSFNEEFDLESGTYYLCVASLGSSSFTSMPYKFKISKFPITVSDAENNIENELESGDEKNECDDSYYLDFAIDNPVFDDVSENSWFFESVMTARKAGLINGFGGNEFKPYDNVTVSQAISMAARIHAKIHGAEIRSANDGEKWYAPYIGYMEEQLGAQFEFEDYEKNASRAETAYIFSLVFENEFADASTIEIPDVSPDDKYSSSIYRLYSLGILKGDDNIGTFNPERTFNRAECASVLSRIYSFYFTV